MHSRRKTIGYLLLLMLIITPAWAPLTRPGLPAWRVGALPALRLSSGPLSAALAPAWALHAAGVDAATAVKIGLILGVILAALFIFLGVRTLWGEKAGALAAILTIYSPIFLSALYGAGVIASPWLLVGGASMLWSAGKRSWRRVAIVMAGLLLTVASLFRVSPQPPFALHRLFEFPWGWPAPPIDLRSPFAWTPGLIVLILALIVAWLCATRRDGFSRDDVKWCWQFLLTALFFMGLSLFAGDKKAALLLLSVIPLAVVASLLLRFSTDAATPALWAALLLLPVLAAGPALSPDFAAYPIPEQPAAIFGDQQIMLIDVRLDSAPAPGQTVALDAVWQALQPIDFDYNIFVHVVDDAGNLVAQLDTQPVGGDRPMTSWLPGEIIHDAYQLAIPPDAPPSLHVQMGLYNWQTLKRLPLASGGNALAISH